MQKGSPAVTVKMGSGRRKHCRRSSDVGGLCSPKFMPSPVSSLKNDFPVDMVVVLRGNMSSCSDLSTEGIQVREYPVV